MRLIAASLLSAGCVVAIPVRTQHAPPPAPVAASAPAYAPPPAPPPYAPPPPPEPAYAAPQTFSFSCAHATPGGGYCPILVPHEHPYPPETSAADGGCASVADGFRYEGVHPVSGGGWCELSLLHLHDFAPLVGVAWASPTPGVYVYDGPPRGAAVEGAPAPRPEPVVVEQPGSEAVRKTVKAVKVIGKVGEAVGKGAATYLKGFVDGPHEPDGGTLHKGKKSKSSGSSHGGHHGGGHGGHH